MSPGDQPPDIHDLARPILDLYGPHDDHDDEPAPADDGPDTRYARQPLFPVDPDHYEAIRAATERDSDRYLNAGLAPVECRHCRAIVEVKKLGPGYTSVQWNSASLNQCAYFTAERDAGNASSRARGCPNLAKSIRHAVAEGHLEETGG